MLTYCRNTLGIQNAETVVSLNNLAELHMAEGDHTNAKKYQDLIVETLQKNEEQALKSTVTADSTKTSRVVEKTVRATTVDEVGKYRVVVHHTRKKKIDPEKNSGTVASAGADGHSSTGSETTATTESASNKEKTD